MRRMQRLFLMQEKELKQKIALDLIQLGFKVYLDNRNVPNPEKFEYFYGDKNSLNRPDIIVFHNSNQLEKAKAISNPFGIEVKTGDSFGKHIVTPLLQMTKYKNTFSYKIPDNQNEYKLNALFLTTFPAVYNNEIYAGSKSFLKTQTADAKYAIDWFANRMLYELGEKEKLQFGLLKRDAISYYLTRPNYRLRLTEKGGMQKEWENDFKLVET